MNKRLRRILKTSLGVIGLIGILAVVPPAYQAYKHLCPARPNGISEAKAVPNFARKYKVSCMACHTAWPALNEQGRQFMINGYRMERDEKKGMLDEVDGMTLPEAFAFSGGLVKLRPYDKNNQEEEFKHRAFHELELFLAGDIGKNFSVFTEFEMEDETGVVNAAGSAFQVKVAAMQMGWSPKTWGNIKMAYRGFFDMDPYQTITNHGRLTRSSRLLGGAGAGLGQTLGGDQQTSMFYGEVGKEDVGSLYYAAGLTTAQGDNEGEGGKGANLRIALDSMRGIAVGAFGSFGRTGQVGCTTASCRAEYKTVGIDTLVEVFGLTARAAFAGFYDRTSVTPATDAQNTWNKSAYVELMYPIMKGKLPILVPTVRSDWKTTNDGRDHAADFTVQLASYFMPNGRAFLEYWAEAVDGHTSGGQPKDSRITAQVEFGF